MTVLQNFYNSLNSKYNLNNKLQRAGELLKDNVNVGEAIVNVFSHTGIAGFKFHLPKREQIRLQSEISDHYTDINNPIQDHIARKPITVSMNGLQGEYFYSVNKIEDVIATITPTLVLVKEFMPSFTNAAMIAKTAKARAAAAISYNKKIADKMGKDFKLSDRFDAVWNELNGVDLFQLMQDLYKLKSAQTRAYLFFEALWKSEALFTVETTLKRFNNMAVQNITAVRDENADIIDFTLEVKQMNFSVTTTTSLKNYTGRTRQQLSAISNKGLDKGKKVQV